MSSDQKFEDELTYAMSRAGEAFRTETMRLDLAGLERGRRAWRRRRAAAAVVSGATVLALAGGAVYVMGPGVPTVSTGPAAAPVTAERLRTVLRAALPAGFLAEAKDTESLEITVDGARANVRFGGSAMVGPLSLSVERRTPEAAMQARELRCANVRIGPQDDCRTETLTDGSKLILVQGAASADGVERGLSARLAAPDGRLIEITTSNKSVSPGGAALPLTADQATAAMTSLAWDAVVADLPVAASSVQPVWFPGEEVLATVAGLLPHGLTPADASTGKAGYVGFTVTDGEGAGLVEVVLEDRRGYLGNPPADYATAQPLPDGTRLLEIRNEGWWTVQALRPDGLVVIASAHKSAGLLLPVSRQRPPLTMAQLKDIATAAVWKMPG
ncbi:hypothetical protein ACIA8O_26460 [Kitasatospora sp. NPDC051853]|uniref:hypothetical protein n=1 Tax=Kitasatospora sp. NPDC051853 TaxID=3364058 RepID=UPI0037A2E267